MKRLRARLQVQRQSEDRNPCENVDRQHMQTSKRNLVRYNFSLR